MRLVKYGARFFKTGLRSNLFIALEIALLLIAANSLLGFYNNLSILYEPYEDILKKDGVIYFDNSYAFDPEKSIYKAELFENLSKLKGGALIYKSYTIPYYDDGKSAQVIHIIDDRIYDRLVYPTSSGSIKAGCAVASYQSGFKAGDVIKTELGEIKISGILTQSTYYPVINSCEDVDGLHRSFTSEVDDAEFVLMGLKSAKKLYGEPAPSFLSDAVMISFAGCTADEAKQNYELLSEKGQVWELDKINTRTAIKLKEQYARFVPFIYMISIAVIIGLISFCIVTSLDNKNDMDILYNCGAGSADLFLVMLYKNLCIIITAVIISALALLIMKLTGLLTAGGITLRSNLIPCSASIACACVIMCQLVSAVSEYTLRKRVR